MCQGVYSDRTVSEWEELPLSDARIRRAEPGAPARGFSGKVQGKGGRFGAVFLPLGVGRGGAPVSERV